ncbi:MAG: carbohydrate ABC transporter permease [Anaeromyxobacter sp.]
MSARTSTAPASPRPSRLKRLTWPQLAGVVLLCLVGAAFLYPLLWLLDASFRAPVEIFQWPPVLVKDFPASLHTYTLDSFRAAFLHWNAGWALLMSVVVTLAGILLTLLVCSLCAYAFAFLEFPGRGPLFFLVLATMMLPMTTMIVPYYKVIRGLHLSNNLMGLVVPYAVSAFGVFMLRQYYIRIPRSLFECARVEGANHLRIWWSIVLPLSRPGAGRPGHRPVPPDLERLPVSDRSSCAASRCSRCRSGSR